MLLDLAVQWQRSHRVMQLILKKFDTPGLGSNSPIMCTHVNKRFAILPSQRESLANYERNLQLTSSLKSLKLRCPAR
jgi:hypothetical protein